MKAINADTLRDWQRQGREFILVDTLPARTFAEGHLPGAINLMFSTRPPPRFQTKTRRLWFIVPVTVANGPVVPLSAWSVWAIPTFIILWAAKKPG